MKQQEYAPGRRPDGTSGTPTADDSKPLPDATNEVPESSAPPPAPDVQQSVPQSDVVRRLDELLRDNKVTPDMEKRLGMTRDEMQQFVKKFEKREPRPAARPGREIQAKPGEERALDPNLKAPDFQPGVTASNRNARGSSNLTEDNASGLSEGSLSNIPPELRKRFEAFKASNARTRPTPRPASK